MHIIFQKPSDANIKRRRGTLWQKQIDGNLKPIRFASGFLSETEKMYDINDLELLAVAWGLKHFRLYISGKPTELITDHQALELLIKRNRSNKTYSARLTGLIDWRILTHKLNMLQASISV